MSRIIPLTAAWLALLALLASQLFGKLEVALLVVGIPALALLLWAAPKCRREAEGMVCHGKRCTAEHTGWFGRQIKKD